ncbi:MAG: SusC/RagA family TonB-linked outer membrane protein [Gemmatimonas sp.]|uniref:SusC/RagA family TonB-linked outer membrane protein n=1 Tax=Gemmatimonas sp. TaxID=1962908 RepID=UPI00391F5755
MGRTTAAPGRTKLAVLLLLLAAGPVQQATAQSTGAIRGTVAGTAQQPLPGVRITIVGVRDGERTNANGLFSVVNIPAGEQIVRVATIGYATKEQKVTVVAGQTVTVDFQLSALAVSLNEMVVTGTAGQQTRRSQPAQVAVLNTEEMMRNAPRSGMAGVLQSALPGVSVTQGGATTGAAQRIRIRGASSISLSNEPLVFIDGVRADSRIMSSARPGVGSGSKTNAGGQGVSRLNDLNPEDIASIEVVKGPAAATLYGADASAGVIQIITKQGQAGAFKQNLVTQMDNIDLNWTPPDNWGVCTAALIAAGATPICVGKAPGTLVSDNPLVRDNVIQTGQLQQINWSGTGGTETLKNYISLGDQSEAGILPSSRMRRTTLRTNSTWAVRPNLTLNFGVSYFNTFNQQPDDNHSAYGYGAGYGIGSPLTVGLAANGWFAPYRNSPVIASIRNEVSNRRCTPKVEVNHQPTSWFNHRLVVGLDYSGESRLKLVPKNDSGYWAASDNPGFVNQTRVTNNLYTVDYLGNVTNTFGAAGQWVSSLAFGTQIIVNSQDLLFANGLGLATNSARVISATAQTVGGETWEETRSVGLLSQWQLAYRNRLFFQTGLRADRNSAFGTKVGTIFLPKAGASWVISEESFLKDRIAALNLLRLRAAYGVTGRAPLPGTSLETWTPVPTSQSGTSTPGLSLLNPGNPDLRPERGSETELGFEAGLLNDRVGLEFTYFRKVTNDLILQRQLPTSAGYSENPFVNIGSVQNSGVEAVLRYRVFDRGRNALDVQLNANTLRNELTDLGDIPAFGTSPRFIEGYPLSSFFTRTINRVDVARNVAVVSDTLEYAGTMFPTREAAFSTNLTLFGNWRITTQVDGKFGATNYDQTTQYRTRSVVRSREAVAPEQLTAEVRLPLLGPYVDSQNRPVSANLVETPFLSSSDFVRFREIAVTYTVPSEIARRMRLQRANVTFGGRNLALWTRYTGNDPESITNNTGLADQFRANEFFNLPPTRRFFLRLSLDF